MRFKIEGVVSAMVTPFTKGGKYVDFDKVGAVAQHLVKRGAHGLFPCGTTGEGMLMSADERMEVVEEVVVAVKGNVPVIAHTGAIDFDTTLELTRHAQEIGAQAAGVVCPFFYKYDDRSLIRHFTRLAKAVPRFPIFLYNIPVLAGNTLSPEVVLHLGETVENIVGVKDSTGNMSGLTRLIAQAPKDFIVMNGEDGYGYQALLAGAAVAVSGTSNAVIEVYRGIYDNVKKGNLKKAWKHQALLAQCAQVLQYGRRAAIFKEGMRLHGCDAGYVRSPQMELTRAEKGKLAKGLRDLGVA